MTPLLYHQVTGLTTAKLLCAGLSTLRTAAIATPGGGYNVGDIVTVAGGTFLNSTTFTVTGVDHVGRVKTLALLNGGVATAKPSNPVSTTVDPAGGTGLTLTLTWNDNAAPGGTRLAVIQAETQSIRWRDDGEDPTAAVGMLLASGASMEYEGPLNVLKVIEATATAKINATFYG